MAMTSSSPDEAMTTEELRDSEPSDAFAKLMAPSSRPAAKTSLETGYGRPPFKDRMALGAFIADPAAHSNVVIFYDDDFVAIRDRFPKATVHALLLPRRPHDALLRKPLDVLSQDATLLARARVAAERLRQLVATELARTLGRDSRADAQRQAVLDGSDTKHQELPSGRDWLAQVRCGVHAVPSMSHLHIHVISRDMHAQTLRHRKHYNSFNTPFFVGLDELPLPEHDPRRNSKKLVDTPYLSRDLVCWRCRRNFGNQFKRLKEHLETEFHEWRRE